MPDLGASEDRRVDNRVIARCTCFFPGLVSEWQWPDFTIKLRGPGFSITSVIVGGWGDALTGPM